MRATYDLMDDLVTWTDGNGRTEVVERDLGGNIVRQTDRKGQVTLLRYDELGRRTFAGFGTTGSPGSETYDSTIEYAYDDGDRLVELDDSQFGMVGLAGLPGGMAGGALTSLGRGGSAAAAAGFGAATGFGFDTAISVGSGVGTGSGASVGQKDGC